MSGYWATRTYRDPDTGAVFTRRWWVDTPDPAPRRAAARRRAINNAAAAAARREAARRAAARARAAAAAQAAREAARILREKQMALARKRSFDALQRRQAELLRQRRIIRDQKNMVTKTASTYISEREDMRAEMAQAREIRFANAQREQQKINAERQAQAEADSRKRLLLLKIGNRDTRRRAATGLPQPATQLDENDIRDLELVLKAEADRANKGQFDAPAVERLREAYDKYAVKVYDKYEDVVVAINAAIDKGNIERARRLYAEYQKLVPEFQRLFGTGKNPLQEGAYNKFYQNYQTIGAQQREWWKRQMKETLQKTVAGISDRPDRTLTAEQQEAQELLGILNGTIKTRQVVDGVDRFGRLTYRNFTIEEELAARQAEKIMQMEKMRAIYAAQQRNIKIQMLREGMVEYKGQYFERAQVPVIQAAERVMASQYGGKFEPKEPHDIHQFVDKMLTDWDAQHPKPPLVRQGRGYTARSREALANWEALKKRYEDEAYKFFGMGPQGLLEKGIATPGISHILQLLNAPFSVIGAGGRTIQGAVSGGKYTTIGGLEPTLADAPKEVRDRIMAQAPKTGGSLTMIDLNAQYRNKLFAEWVASPEGQKWRTGLLSGRQAEESAENQAFYRSGPTGNLYDDIKKLNAFGSQPFQNEGANLLASLLLDPLNAIPLNFTKYLARGKYALEMTEGTSKLLRPLTASKTFLTVDEGTLGAWKYFRNIEGDLAAKGMTRDRFLDTLRERVQGVKSKAEREHIANQLFRELGIEARKINEAQLSNLIESAILRKADDEGLDLLTQSDELAAKMDAAEKAAKQSEAARQKFAKSETDRVSASLRAREAEAKAARAAEGVEYRKAKTIAEKRAISQEAAVRARQAKAAGAVAGPSPSAKKAAPKAETYRGIPVKRLVQEKGKPARAAYFDKRTRTIHVDEAVIAKKFEERAWTQPLKRADGSIATPLPGNAFRSLKEWRDFVMAHEAWHSRLTRRADETIAEYEDRVNAAALSSARSARTGKAGTIETKMASGDVAGSQADNVAEGVARGGTVESGGAIRSDTRPPEVTELAALPGDPVPVLNADVLVQKLGQMSEAEWYAAAKAKMGAILASQKSTPAAKAAARRRLAQIKLAELAMEVEKKGGSYVSWKDRASFQKRVLKRYGKDVEGYIAPSLVAPFVQSARDAVVEQARTYYRLLSQASPVDIPGVEGIKMKGRTVDFMPMDVFRSLDQRMSAAIREARGFAADTTTRARGSRLDPDPDATNALGRMTDRNPVVLAAKKKVLKEYANETGNVVSMVAYDEARKVLWKGYVQNRTALRLLALAKKKAAASGGDLEKTYLALRQEMARREARRQFGGMAFGKFYGVNPDAILAEFIARYGDDGTIRHFEPELTTFQRKTLEANFAALSGKSSGDDVREFLQSANRPPLENRELTKKFLTQIGAWSPRKAEDFVAGARSWSIADEADYWRTAYGEVPEWADEAKLADSGLNGFNHIFDDQQRYIDQHKEWGVFSRSHDLALRTEGVTQAQLEKLRLTGDPELDIPARRSLELQRRYVIERFGTLVSKDGKTLDTMPWLMYPEELRAYLGKYTAKSMPEGLIQTARELEEVEALIAKAINRFWDQYIDVKAADGPIHYHDVFRLASEVQAALLANPKWARRYRDVFGKTLDSWAWLNRWLVFSNPSFMVVNVIDAPLKTAWYRFTRRGLFNRALVGDELAAKADGLTPQMFNWDSTPAMYRTKQMRARERVLRPRGLTTMDRVVDRALATVQVTGEVFPEVAGKAELAMRMRLAKGMYPEVYRMALKRLKDPELAHAASLDYIKKEVSKMWPTAGDGPLEKLWNRFVPFASYTLRNKVLWISEAINHPVVLVHFDRIGRAIEAHNVREWEANPENKGQPMPPHLRRLIELPWAKGYYIDLAQFTDASRGLKPLYDTEWKSTQERITDWFRVVSPTMQAGIYALFNAFNLFPRTAWELGDDGRYRLVTVPYLEPWSKDAADINSVIWLADVLDKAKEYGIDGWSSGEASAFIGQVLFFNAVKTYDKMSVTYGWYKGLSFEAKQLFQKTPEGQAFMEWLAERSRISAFKGDLLNMMAEHDKDPGKWWFTHQSDGWKDRVTEGRNKIRLIRDAFAVELYRLQPGTAEYREMKAKMYLAISDVYTQYPELMENEVFSKSASEWAKQLEDWQTDKLTDDFMALANQRPSRAQYESTVAYNKAVEAWERQKSIFLKTYPQVAERLASEIFEVESVRDKIEKQWDTVLSRVAKRNEAIEAAKAIIAEVGRESARGKAAQERLDLLYLQNDLDYSLLERDYAASYFSPDDYKRLPDGSLGELRQPGLLKRATSFIDFDRAVYEKHRRNGTLEEYLAKAEYGQAMKAAMLYAKGGDPFGKFDPAKWFKYLQDHPSLMEGYFRNNPGKKQEWATTSRYIEGIRALWKQAGDDPAKWVQLLKQDRWLMEQYFARNPGKKAEWARMDSYIRHISVWGALVGASKWDEANGVWNDLPKWVKDMYYARHPGKRERAQQTAEYMGYMQKWISLFESGDDEKAMQYFNSLPKWARERYYKNHPENRLRFEAGEKLSTWLREYYAAEPQYRGEYLAKHPEFKRWLAENANTKELERFAILQAYRSIPKGETWLRKVYRERYPEVFSAEAAGERKLKSVYSTLAKHPGVLPEFEKWVEEIWRTYGAMLKHAPRPLSSYFERDREEERRWRSRLRSRSAAEVSA